MANIEWRDDFHINVSTLDAQHRTMAELVNRLHRAVADRQAHHAIGAILTELIECTREHFETEERMMLEHGYPEYGAHMREHRDLMEQLETVRRKVTGGSGPVFAAAADFSSDWVMVHLLGSDKKLGAFLNRKNVF
jgi:hemerythrin